MISDPSFREAPAGRGNSARLPRIGIFHPADPAGHIPGGIDTVIRTILKWAPPDLEYTLFGASSDLVRRPVGQDIRLPLGDRSVRFVPIVGADPSSRRSALPLTVRYLLALRRYVRAGLLRELDVLDFHRIDPIALFRNDPRPKNVMIHMDMAVIREEGCDIGWRHAPWLYESIERWLFPRMDRVYCVRQTAIERYKATYPSLAPRFVFIPTWVDNTKFYPPRTPQERYELKQRIAGRLGISAATEILTSVGRLDKQKDPLLLLDAYRAALETRPNIHLAIVGDGILRPQVEARCRSEKLRGKVSMLGAIPPDEIADLLRAADLFVLSSAYEGMPIVVLEALATGLPVVTTDVGEVRLTVKSGVNGFVVSDRSPQAFASAVCMALDQAGSLRGEACERAVAEYVPDRVLGRVYENHRSQAAGTRA